jgi:hypothetical protein
MKALALGWEVHRKFSKVSLQEMPGEGEIQVVERARPMVVTSDRGKR